MEELSDQEAASFRGGVNECVASIAFSASFGGLFGGAGAVIGAVAAATGPNCLEWW